MSATKSSSPSIDLRDRDVALLRGLFECRIMTAPHVATLFFDGKREDIMKRLATLKATSFLGGRVRRVNEPAILFLTSKAFLFLSRAGHLAGFTQLGANTFESDHDCPAPCRTCGEPRRGNGDLPPANVGIQESKMTNTSPQPGSCLLARRFSDHE